MCGRFSMRADPARLRRLAEQLGLYDLPSLETLFEQRINIAPTELVPVITSDHHIAVMRWGLVPHWSKERKGGGIINARGETVHSKPAFRDAFRQRRCLVPADGFYEWSKPAGRKKVPHLISRSDGELMCMAGLWDESADEQGAPVRTFTIITTDASPIVAPLHDRMPVIVSPTDYKRWLDAGSTEEVRALLRPTSEGLKVEPCDPAINSPRVKDQGTLF